MRDYGRDYHRGGNFFERAGEKMREWFGGGPEYDRDYGARGYTGETGMRASGTGWDRDRDWDRGTDWTGAGQRGGWRTNNWSNTSADLNTVRGSLGGYGGGYSGSGSSGGYASRNDYGTDYDRERTTFRADRPSYGRGMDYDRDYGGSTWGGYGSSGRTERNRDWNDTRWNRGWEGQERMRDQEGRGGSPMGNEYFRGGSSRDWRGNDLGGREGMGRVGYNSSMGGGGYDAGNDWGDYNQGGYGGDRFRSSNSGGVEPGRQFRGYGHGSTSGNCYEPL